MNLFRTITIASHVFREVIRDRVLYVIGFFAFVLIMAVQLLPEVSAGSEDKILKDLGLAAISALSLVVAVFVGTGLVNKEIEKRTVLVLIAKPVSRLEFVLGKHLGLSAVLAVLLASMTAIYLGTLEWNQIEYPLGSILVAVLYNLLELSLIAAAAILLGVFTSSLLSTLITFAIYAIGHFSRDLVILGNIADKPEIQRLTRMIYLVLPDLSRLDFKNQAVYGVLPDSTTLLVNAGYGFLYIILLLALAILVFSQREF